MGNKKYLLHLIGGLLAICGLVVAIHKLYLNISEVRLNEINSFIWLTIVALSISYFASNFLLAHAWGKLLEFQSLQVNRAWLFKTFFISQIGKYTPGNIAHFAGRQVMGVEKGYSGKKIAKSQFWELVLLALTGTFIAAFSLPLYVDIQISPVVIILIFTIVTGISIYYFLHLISRKIVISFLLYVCFFILTGLIFSMFYQILSDETFGFERYCIFISVFTLAWLIGFLTPGAPAGIGVRETILILSLDGLANESGLIFSIVLSRLANLAGDLLAFFYGVSKLTERR